MLCLNVYFSWNLNFVIFYAVRFVSSVSVSYVVEKAKLSDSSYLYEISRVKEKRLLSTALQNGNFLRWEYSYSSDVSQFVFLSALLGKN